MTKRKTTVFFFCSAGLNQVSKGRKKNEIAQMINYDKMCRNEEKRMLLNLLYTTRIVEISFTVIFCLISAVFHKEWYVLHKKHEKCPPFWKHLP